MKYNIHFLVVFFALAMTFSSCLKEEEPVAYQPETTLVRSDVLTQVLVNTPVVSFQSGTASYDISFDVITPNNDEIKKVNIFKTFTDAATMEVSSEVSLITYDIPAGQTVTQIRDALTYAQLKEGITIGGAPLPDDDLLLGVGSSWELRIEPIGASSDITFAAPGMVVAVLSPFAGIYTVIESAYFRIGADNGGWNGTEIFIGSVDENTFSHKDQWGPFASPGQFVFDLNDDDTFTVLDDPSQLYFSGHDMLTCQEDEAIFTNVPCAGSNVLERKMDGKHLIKLTYGYFTNGSGPREFYEVLEKKVN